MWQKTAWSRASLPWQPSLRRFHVTKQVLPFSPQAEMKEDILYYAPQQTLPDIVCTYAQLVARRVWGGGCCSTKKPLVKTLQVCKLDYDAQFGLLRTVSTLSSASCESWGYPNSLLICCVAQHPYYVLDHIAETETPRMFFCARWSSRII